MPKKPKPSEDLRLSPERRLYPLFDEQSVAQFPIATPQEMGFRVLDNCTEEHIQ